MANANGSPVPYRVTYSEYVRTGLKELIARATEAGFASEMLAALQNLDRVLKLYPQFGEPLRDLKLESARMLVGTVPPLVVQYILVENSRQVFVVWPITVLPNSGF